MRLLAALVVLSLSVPGCSIFTAEEPPIPDSTMVDVLVGLHLAEARSEVDGPLPAGMRDSILSRHGLTPSDYEAAVAHYADHPETYSDIYDRVLDRLSAERHGLREPPLSPHDTTSM